MGLQFVVPLISCPPLAGLIRTFVLNAKRKTMPKRKPAQAMKVYLKPEEYQAITDKAEQTGLSMSTFARRICLGYEVKSVVDQRAVLELIRVKAEIGRLGGLLKFSLGEKTLERSQKINRLISELTTCSAEITEVIKAWGA